MNKEMNLNFQTILNSIDDGIFITNPDGIIIMVNKAVERSGGKLMGELVGRSIYDLENEGYCSEFATKKVLKTKNKNTIVQKLADGKEYLVTAIPCFDKDTFSMVVACERDISEIISLQEQLNQAEELKKKYEVELEGFKSNIPTLEDAVCASEAMSKVVILAQKLALVDSTVLIAGESGTGKEIIADHIYKNSKRKDKTFVKINCSAIPENLLESEMFGYEAGAFSGASEDGKPGYFEIANNGTIFLDEVGELPLKLQVKLLRVIQERKLVRIGGAKEIPLDIRIIAATNRDLKAMLVTGEFRKDLYYRLNVTTITVPPLRERKDDVLELVNHFLHLYNENHNMNKKMSSQGLKILLNYHWPGNVRELENLIESLVITSEEDSISPEEVKEYLDVINTNDTKSPHNYEGRSLQELVDLYEKQLLEAAWNKDNDSGIIARHFGSTRSTINRKLSKYKIR